MSYNAIILLVAAIASGNALPFGKKSDDIVLPSILRLESSPLKPGLPARIFLEVKSSDPVEFIWQRTVYPDGSEPFTVPIRGGDRYQPFHKTENDIHQSTLDVAVVSAKEATGSTFSVRIITEKNIIIEMFIPNTGLTPSHVDLPTVHKLSDSPTIVEEGSTNHLKFSCDISKEDRLLNVQKWSLATESNVTSKRVQFLRDRALPLTIASHKNVTNTSISTSLVFSPFLKQDSGIYETSLTIKSVGNVIIRLYMYAEVASILQEQSQILVGAETCSGDSASSTTATHEVELLLRPGVDDCLRCFAKGLPRPSLRVSKLSSINNVTSVPVIDHLKAVPSLSSISYPVTSFPDSPKSPLTYLCIGSHQTPWPRVEILLVKLTSFKAVQMISASQNVTITKPKEVTFKCEASGVPAPEIEFYRAPKGSNLNDMSLDPEVDLLWGKIHPSRNINIEKSINEDTGTVEGVMTIRQMASMLYAKSDAFEFKCVARNKLSYAVSTMQLHHPKRTIS